MRRFAVCLAAVVCAASLSGVAKAASICDSTSGNLVQNCGFESGSFSNWSLTGNLEGGVGGNYVYVGGPDDGNQNSGSYYAALGAGSAYSQTGTGDMYGPVTTLSQTLAPLSGQTYQVAFYVDNVGCAVDDGCPGYYDYFDASFNGDLLTQQYNAVDSGSYIEYVYDVTTSSDPAGNSGVLQFDTTNDNGYFFLDDVTVTAVGAAATPEPTSLALFGSGLLGVVGIARRKMRRA